MIGIYARVSTQEQAVNGHSIDEQIERMTKYCDALKWTIYKVYVDAGYSGANTQRPALQRLIKDVESGKVDRVLVYKLDRLSRSQKDTLLLIEDVFLAHKCDFVSMCENFDTSTPFGKAMIGVLAVFSQLEREQIKERMSMGKEARAKQGKFNGSGHIPIGYNYVNGEFVVNEFEKMQIIEIFESYVSGVAPQKICDRLNQAGHTHKYGKWQGKAIRDILSSKTYLGYVKFRGEWFKGSHEPIISEDLFDQVQVIKDQKRKEYEQLNRRIGKVNSYLGGFLYCAHCGAKYFKYAKHINGVTYAYYCCISRTKKKPDLVRDPNCHNKNWKMEKLDNLIFEEIKKLATDPNCICDIKTQQTDERPKIITTKIKDLDAQLERLMDLYAIGSMPLDILQERIHALNDQKIKLEADLEEIEKEKKEKMTQDDAMRLIKSFGDVLDHGDLDEIRNLIGTLVDRIMIDGDDVTIFWAFA